jgi:hypothetical protein
LFNYKSGNYSLFYFGISPGHFRCKLVIVANLAFDLAGWVEAAMGIP